MSLPQEIRLSIQEILEPQASNTPSHVVSSTSSYVDTLNEFFPDDSSLARIETVQSQLAAEEQNLRAQIASLRADMRRDQNTNKIQLIQEMISDLMSQISRIREKAAESEAVVRSITKDIQRLDRAKNNLILSMTTLKRFQMIVNALNQLEAHIKDYKYLEISQTLSAIKQLSVSFKPYLAIPQVMQIWSRIQTLQGEVRSKVESEFETFFKSGTTRPVQNAVIKNACLVVDVIGDDFRSHLLDIYCTSELKEYRRIFRPVDEAGHLDNISRRFAFFRRILTNYENNLANAFPDEWHVGLHLCVKFIDMTREDMAVLLNKVDVTLSVGELMDTLRHISDFELLIANRYGKLLPELFLVVNSMRPTKSISSAFEPHMSIFVDAQDKALSDILSRFRSGSARSSLDWTAASGNEPTVPTTVLPSSTELFYFYGQSLEQCAKLSRGKPLFDLSKIHRKWLKNYAEDILVSGLKKSSTAPRRSLDAQVDERELKNICLLINTADYVQMTTLQLENKIREEIDENYKDRVTFEAERDIFIGVINSAILALLRELEYACESSFNALSKMSWATVANVSGSSAYINSFTASVERVLGVVRPLIDQKKYLRNFYDKASLLIVAQFTNSLVRSRPLKEIGAEQLLFDVQALTSCLLNMPGNDSSTTSTHGKNVLRMTTRLEKLLKVIIIPAQPQEDFVTNYTILIGDASFSNFQKVLDLKGTPKNDQNQLLDVFVAITSTKNELETNSFLSSLDMEPPTASQVGSLTSPGGSGLSLPTLLVGTGGTPAEGLYNTLGSPPQSGPESNALPKIGDTSQKREVFSDLRRFVSFGLRKENIST